MLGTFRPCHLLAVCPHQPRVLYEEIGRGDRHYDPIVGRNYFNTAHPARGRVPRGYQGALAAEGGPGQMAF
jgi:hypothetical protein